MIGWIFWGLLGAAALTTIVIVVNGIITKIRIQKELEKQLEKQAKECNNTISLNKLNKLDAKITKIDRCNNTITLKDLGSDNVYEIRGDGISCELYERQRIVIYK